MKVTALPKDPGPAGWDALLGPPPPATPLDGERQADILIIGAGFAGLAAARRVQVQAPEVRVVVLEASRVASGPAGRNSGFMIDLPHHLASDDYQGADAGDLAQTRANRAAIGFMAEAAAAYGLPDEAFAMRGKINAAATARGEALNTAYAAQLALIGEAHEVLDAGALQALTGSAYYRHGLFTPGTAMLQPALLMRGLHAGLARGGVAIHEESPVISLERAGQVWQARTPKGRVSAPKVILAVNGHLQSFGQFRGRLAHVFTYASMTRALSGPEVAALGGAPAWALTPADPMGTTVRRITGQGGARLVVRNCFTFDPSMEVDAARIARVGAGHDAAFAARFPALRGIEMAYRWGGRLCLSLNDVPAFGEVEPGLIAAGCQNGLGTARGTLGGMMAADLALGAGSELLAWMLGQPAPRRLPPAPIAALGARVRIALAERRAGREV